jgi:hypothetical protein
MLTFKCRGCGKIFQAEDEFSFLFAEPADPDENHSSQCEDCKNAEITKIAAEYDPEKDEDLAKECRTDGSEWK